MKLLDLAARESPVSAFVRPLSRTITNLTFPSHDRAQFGCVNFDNAMWKRDDM